MKQRQVIKHDDVAYTRLGASAKLNNSSDDDEQEETELLPRKKPAIKEVPTIEVLVNEEDTLQAISIRYRCTIEELKRLNNIHKENEIYARRSIKVPSRPFSAALAGIHISGKSSPETSDLLIKPLQQQEDNGLETKLNNTLQTLQLTSTNPNGEDFNTIIFNSQVSSTSVQVQSSLQEDGEGEENDKSSIGNTVLFNKIEEEVSLLPQEPVDLENVNTSSSKTKSTFSCSGADADISWIALIVCIVIVIFVGPLIYVLYIAEHPEEYHHEAHLKPT